jgi:signal transduction histidine kinase
MTQSRHAGSARRDDELAEFIADNKQRVIERWKQIVKARLELALDESQLVDHIPEFIDDTVTALRDPEGRWPGPASASNHGRQRMRAGVDIGTLTEEVTLIVEAICDLREEDGRPVDQDRLRHLIRVVGRGNATSARTYAAMRDAELAQQAGEHFSFVAHELRTPLQSARMAAALLQSCAEADRPTYMDRLHRSLDRLTELIDESLVRARQAAKPDVRLQRLRARELVDAAWADVADHARARRLEPSLEVDSFEIEGDRRLLVSALGNLLKNAVKFTREGGHIRIRAHAQEDSARFEVEDECGGIPEELLPRLFEPFMQGQRGKGRGGFGLGLTIVKQAAEAHSGSVRVLNRPSQNCCFVLELPLRRD